MLRGLECQWQHGSSYSCRQGWTCGWKAYALRHDAQHGFRSSMSTCSSLAPWRSDMSAGNKSFCVKSSGLSQRPRAPGGASLSNRGHGHSRSDVNLLLGHTRKGRSAKSRGEARDGWVVNGSKGKGNGKIMSLKSNLNQIKLIRRPEGHTHRSMACPGFGDLGMGRGWVQVLVGSVDRRWA